MSDDHPSLSLREAMRRLADPAEWAEYEALAAAGWIGYPPPHPDLGPRYDTPEKAADFLRALRLRQAFEDEVVAALRRGVWRLCGRAYASGPIIPIDGTALHRSDDPDTPAGGYILDFQRERVLQNAAVRYWDVAVQPSGPSSADIGLSPRAAALRYATSAEREKYDRLCAEGCTGYDNPRTQNPTASLADIKKALETDGRRGPEEEVWSAVKQALSGKSVPRLLFRQAQKAVYGARPGRLKRE